MENSTSRTQQIVTIAFLMAVEIVLTRFASITTPYFRISFGFLPIIIIGIMYGPLWAGTAYAVGDIIGGTLFPVGPFFPGFTLSAFLVGLIYGLFFYKREITLPRVIIACVVVVGGVYLGLGTLWLTTLLGKGYMVLLPVRIVKELITLPIYIVLIMALKTAFERILKSSQAH